MDPDGQTYWIELAHGWQCDGVHAIAESTKNAARARLDDVRECECSECRGALHGRTVE